MLFRVFRKDNPCIVQREINNYKKKVVMAAPKNQINHKLYETMMEEACLKTQVKGNRNQEKNRSLFASVQKTEKADKVSHNNQRSANRIYIYQTKKKTPNCKKDNKLKPIIS